MTGGGRARKREVVREPTKSKMRLETGKMDNVWLQWSREMTGSAGNWRFQHRCRSPSLTRDSCTAKHRYGETFDVRRWFSSDEEAQLHLLMVSPLKHSYPLYPYIISLHNSIHIFITREPWQEMIYFPKETIRIMLTSTRRKWECFWELYNEMWIMGNHSLFYNECLLRVLHILVCDSSLLYFYLFKCVIIIYCIFTVLCCPVRVSRFVEKFRSRLIVDHCDLFTGDSVAAKQLVFVTGAKGESRRSGSVALAKRLNATKPRRMLCVNRSTVFQL